MIWSQWCRLCSREKAETNVDIFINDDEDLKLSTAIESHLFVKITPEDQLPKMICNECWEVVTDFVKFYSRVCKVQERFAYLQSTNKDDHLDVDDIRMKFDLLGEEYSESFHVYPISKLSREDGIAADIKYENESNEIKDYKSERGTDDSEDIDTANDDEWNVEGLAKSSDSDNERVHDDIISRTRSSKTRKVARNSDENVKTVALATMATMEVKKRKFSCKLCSRTFNGICYYRQHMRRTHKKELDVPQYQCDQCSKCFPTELQFRNHMKTHLPLELKQEFPCAYCEKKFTTPYVMQKHISTVHLNEKPYICEECGLAVKSSSSLKVHMLTHTDDRPWRCNICSKAFKNRVGLKRHMDGHSSNKHICSECGCQLNSKASLKRHMVIHSDEKLHKCDYCGREFKRSEALKHHLILHTGLKPYSCNFCAKTFANGSNCRAHKKKSHPDELAALEASGEAPVFTKNIPKLEQLKAITKASDHLNPVVSKQSGSIVKKTVNPIFQEQSTPEINSCWEGHLPII